ncbi:hypothetical protein Pcinc_022223 [Petrolisthes cinctipes]|uniref:DHHA2 domain-containing protein n=1 Tax=Petrolisthes cinctipes TaxID=88211 RepID=A0AAE1KH44_PETCI|nr:hypothetical protein Pcinc_022223 [Petrolisthes cinctipes]
MPPIIDFLHAIKKTLGCECPRSLHVVLGNEACDLDSAVSALVYAFLLHSIHKDKLVVPVLNIPARDYLLRTEVKHWLHKHNIQQNSLVFRDEIELNKTGVGLEVSLVDHNVLAITDSHLDPSIVFVLDHHKLERTPGSASVVVEPVGSCCTLVAEQLLDTNPSLLDHTTASLLHGTILLDTVNLNEAAKRVTLKDVQMIDSLETYISPSPHRDQIFQELTTAKKDVSDLTSEQLLRKDVKVVSGGGLIVGMASLPMMVQEYLARAGVSESLAEHSSSCHYDLIVLMGISISDQHVTRDLAIFSSDHSLREKLVSELRGAEGGVLQLMPQPSSVDHCEAFLQDNVGASRKVVLPLVRDWLSRL